MPEGNKQSNRKTGREFIAFSFTPFFSKVDAQAPPEDETVFSGLRKAVETAAILRLLLDHLAEATCE